MSIYGTVGVRGGAARELRTAHRANNVRQNFGAFGSFGASGMTPSTGQTRGSGGYVYQEFLLPSNERAIVIVSGPSGPINKQASKDQARAIYDDIRVNRGQWNPVGKNDAPGASAPASTAKGGKVNVLSLVGTAAESTGAEGKAVANIIKGFQTGGKNGGLTAAAGAVGVLGPGIIEAAGDFIKSRKDNPRVLARKLAKAKRKCHKTPKGSRRHAKWCHKVEMYKQMIAQLRADQSMADISPAVAGIEGPTDDLPTWLPYAAGGALLLVVAVIAASNRKAA